MLCQDRPGDVILAYEAAATMSDKFMKNLMAGIYRLDVPIKLMLEEILQLAEDRH